MRVVLDCNVVVSATLTPEGASATIVELALLGTFRLCLSRLILDEYRRVLSRPKFSRHADRTKALLRWRDSLGIAANFTETGHVTDVMLFYHGMGQHAFRPQEAQTTQTSPSLSPVSPVIR